jgi:hypothetical protein
MVLTEIDPRESALRLKFRDLPLADGLRSSLALWLFPGFVLQ